MIQAIKTQALVEGNDEKEISFEYDELEENVTIYLDNKFICFMDYPDNFKAVIKRIQEKW